MTKDYKHTPRRPAGGAFSGWMGLAVGLGLGLTAAVGVHVYDRRVALHGAAPIAPMIDDAHGAEEKRAPASQVSENEPQFEFYDMLPKYEVVVPEKDGEVAAAAAPTGKIDKPGAYILQAGSYRNQADADRVRSMLAQQGVQSSVQKVTVDSDTWHRVRIGPITSLSVLEDTRRKLREAQVDALVIRVGG